MGRDRLLLLSTYGLDQHVYVLALRSVQLL